MSQMLDYFFWHFMMFSINFEKDLFFCTLELPQCSILLMLSVSKTLCILQNV